MKSIKILTIILALILAVTSVSAYHDDFQFGRNSRNDLTNFGSGSFRANANSRDFYGFDISGNANLRDFTRTSSFSDSQDINDILARALSGSSSYSNSISQGYNLNIGDCGFKNRKERKSKYTYFDQVMVQNLKDNRKGDTALIITRQGCDGLRGNNFGNTALSNSGSNNYFDGRLLTDSRALRDSSSVSDASKIRNFDVNFNELNQRNIQNSFGSSGRGNLIILNRAFSQY